MSDWPPYTATCPNPDCGATVTGRLTGSVPQARTQDGAPVTWLRLTQPILHICHPEEDQ